MNMSTLCKTTKNGRCNGILQVASIVLFGLGFLIYAITRYYHSAEGILPTVDVVVAFLFAGTLLGVCARVRLLKEIIITEDNIRILYWHNTLTVRPREVVHCGRFPLTGILLGVDKGRRVCFVFYGMSSEERKRVISRIKQLTVSKGQSCPLG